MPHEMPSHTMMGRLNEYCTNVQKKITTSQRATLNNLVTGRKSINYVLYFFRESLLWWKRISKFVKPSKPNLILLLLQNFQLQIQLCAKLYRQNGIWYFRKLTITKWPAWISFIFCQSMSLTNSIYKKRRKKIKIIIFLSIEKCGC